MKRLFWAIFGLSVALAFIFYQTWMSLLASWFLHAYSAANWSSPLQYDRLFISDNTLVIVNPKIEEGKFFSAAQIRATFFLNEWLRGFEVDIDFQAPHWDFQTDSLSFLENFEKLLRSEEKWIPINPRIHLKNGSLTWKEGSGSIPRSLNFDLALKPDHGGNIEVDFSGGKFLLSSQKNDKAMEVHCRCQKGDCSSFLAILRFFGLDCPRWEVPSGQIEGEIKAVFPKKQRPYFEGGLTIENLTFNYEEKELGGKIGRAQVLLQKNETVYTHSQPLDRPFFATIGRLDILQASSLRCLSKSFPWEVKEIVGSIQLDQTDSAKIDIEADSESSKWRLQGVANINAHRTLDFGLDLSTSPKGLPKGNLHLALTGQKNDLKIAKIWIEKLSCKECNFLQTLLAMGWPVFHEVELKDGEINAHIEADVTERGIEEVRVKQFEAQNLVSKMISSNADCQFGSLRGYGKVNLGAVDFWQTLSAGLHLEDGSIQFEDFNSSFPINDIQAHVFIQSGVVDHSLITLQIGGLKGKMDVEWGRHKQLLTFKLDGIADDTAKFLPSCLHQGLDEHFRGNPLMVLANLKREANQTELGGTLHIQRTDNEQMDVIHFGCELNTLHPEEKKNHRACGWFHAQKLPIEKFISPFICRNNCLKMSGTVELKGTFDDRFVVIKYDADDLKIENENLCMTIPSLHSPMPGQLIGEQSIDLSDYSYCGSLPIQSACYLEKNTGLEFKEIQGTALFKNDFIRLSPIEARCDGVDFAGELDLDLSDPLPGVFDLSVRCPTLGGKVFQVRQLLSKVDPASLLLKIPLDGEVSCRDRGLHMKFSFLPLDWRFEADFTGKIADGAIEQEVADMALRGIHLNFDYSHASRVLKFSDIQGALFIGKAGRAEEYLMEGHHIHFNQIGEEEPSLDFDVAVKDSSQELFRAAGFTKRDPEGLTGIHLDQQLSHISSIAFDHWQCKVKDWSNIEELKCSSKFDLGKFLQDLQKFRRSGLLFLSHGFIERIGQFLPIEGDVFLEMALHPDQMYSFHCRGPSIRQGGTKEISAEVIGCKQGKKWIVDQLSWDDWSLSFELHEAPLKWRIPFLGLKVKDELLFGLDGDWYEEEGLLFAKLNFCEVDCTFLERFAATQAFIAKWSPKGVLKATGEIEWNLFSQNPWDSCKVALSAKAARLSLRGFPLEIEDVFQLNLLPGRPWQLENIHMRLLHPRSDPALLDQDDKDSYFTIKQLAYLSPQSIGNYFLNAEFQMPYHRVKILGDCLQHHFSDIVDFSPKDLLADVKREGKWKGKLFIESSLSNPSSIRVELEDGLYVFKDKEIELKEAKIDISSNCLEFSASTYQERFPFQIKGKTHWPSCNGGEIAFLSQSSHQPLTIIWNTDSFGKPFFQSITGEFCGCRFFLNKIKNTAEKNSEWLAMEGEVSLDIQRLCPLLTKALCERIQKLKIGSTYSLKGNFWLDLTRAKALPDAFSFRGRLLSENPSLKGIEMQSLQADMQYVPHRLDVENLYIQDPAGSIKMPHCIILQGIESKKWTFFSPSLLVKNFKLGLLKSQDPHSLAPSCNPSKFRSLVLKKMELHDITGDVDDIQTWKGEGSLHFLNPTRKNVFHPLFAIPAEIILRLGLNPHVLNPVTGVILFALKGDRLYLTRFKDVYSEGRGSKFNLAEGPTPSWIDFNGDLSVNIRMKQYNLIFKIAELFTFSIHGNIKKPRYSLQKQTRSLRKSQFLNPASSF